MRAENHAGGPAAIVIREFFYLDCGVEVSEGGGRGQMWIYGTVLCRLRRHMHNLYPVCRYGTLFPRDIAISEGIFQYRMHTASIGYRYQRY
jgi:hypothetical protein